MRVLGEAHPQRQVKRVQAEPLQMIGQLLDMRLMLHGRVFVVPARGAGERVLAVLAVHPEEVLGADVIRLHVVVAQRPGRRDSVRMPDLAEVAGVAHRRRRPTFDGSDRNAAACAAMNASRGFPPYSQCHCVCAQPRPGQLQSRAGRRRLHEEVEVGHPARGTGRSSTSASITSRKAEQPPQGPDVRKVYVRHARSLDPPPGLGAAIRRQEVVRYGRSGRRDGIDEIHRDDRLADNGGPTAAGRTDRRIRIICIRDFDKRHEFFETFDLLPQA